MRIRSPTLLGLWRRRFQEFSASDSPHVHFLTAFSPVGPRPFGVDRSHPPFRVRQTEFLADEWPPIDHRRRWPGGARAARYLLRHLLGLARDLRAGRLGAGVCD